MHDTSNSRDLFFIVNRSSSSQILFLRTDTGIKLPTYDEHVPEDVGFSDPEPFNAWFASQYGIRVRRRYAIDLQGTEEAFFVLETSDEQPEIPPNALWISPEKLGQFSVMPSVHRALIDSWWTQSPESATMPFSQPKGFEDSFAWMHSVLEELAIPIVGEPQQVKNAYVSTVFRCPTAQEDVYLKILPPVFVRETQITARLVEWGITRLPEILAMDSERGLMLTRDMGGCNLTDCCTIDKLSVVVQTVAKFQLAAADIIDSAVPWPFYDWRMRTLTDQMDALFDQAPRFLDDSPYTMSASERAQLRQKLPEWKQLCEDIQKVPVPDTIDHGDLRPGNIRVVSDGFILYDWAWSAITHPFISITGFLGVLRKSLSEDDRKYLRDAYLDFFTGHASRQELRLLFDLVTAVSPLVAVAADGEWLRAIRAALREKTLSATSADNWTLRWRQYYHAKVVRRLL